MCQRKPTGDSSGVPGGHIEKCKTLSTTLQEISHCLFSICFAGATYQGSSKKIWSIDSCGAKTKFKESHLWWPKESMGDSSATNQGFSKFSQNLTRFIFFCNTSLQKIQQICGQHILEEDENEELCE
jgi:hypothetical protein